MLILGMFTFITFLMFNFSLAFAQENSEMIEYNINPLGIGLKHPPNWDVTYDSSKENQCESTCLIILKNNDAANVSLSIYAQASLQSNRECNCDNLLEMMRYKYSTNIEPRNITLLSDNETQVSNGTNGWQMEYLSDNKYNYILWFLDRGTFYEIKYYNNEASYAKHLSEIKGIIDTIEFFPPNTRLEVEDPTKTTGSQPSFMGTLSKQSSSDTNITPSNNVGSEEKKPSFNTEIETSKQSQSERITTSSPLRFNDSNYDEFHSNPNSYLNDRINISGSIFNVITPSFGEGALQVYHLGDSDKLFYVDYRLNDGKFFRDDECVRIEGQTAGSVRYTNLFGAYRTSPSISADNIVKISCNDLVDPNSKVVDLEQTLEKNDIKVTLHRVEFADDKTKVFLTIENTDTENEDDLKFYDTSDATAFQGKRQYEAVYSPNEVEILSTIPPGIEESGTIVFDALEKDQPTEFEFSISRNFDDTEFSFEVGQ